VRIPVNLSSEPFRRDRPILLASGVCAALLAALLGILVFLMVSGRGQAGELRASVDRLNAQLRSIAAEQAKLDATLRQPANAFVLERSALLNTLVERTYPLTEAAEALRVIEDRDVFGKIVVTP